MLLALFMNILEKNSRFSESLLWKLQENYFAEKGVDAWRQGEVPHYATSNPTIAGAYAEMVLGLLRDVKRRDISSCQPLYILNLGAGSGRFDYHFLQKLTHLCSRVLFGPPPFCYIISDFSQKNLDFLQQHSHFRPFIEKGVLDFARFDAKTDTEIQLILSGAKLRKNKLELPLVAIANYLFDSLPQDLFYLKNQKISECRTTLKRPIEPDTSSPTDDLLKKIQLSYTYRPTELPYYEEPFLNELLKRYQHCLSDTHLPFPHIGLRCLARLKQLSSQGLLLLSADKGFHKKSQLLRRRPPHLTPHYGCFSLSVNYHAFKSYSEQQGGISLFPGHQHRSIDIACLLLLQKPDRYLETQLAHDRWIESFGPDDFFTIKKEALEKQIDTLTLKSILAYVRWSGYDARLFQQCLSRLSKLLPKSTANERQDLITMVHRVWDIYFPLGERYDLPFHLAKLLYQMDRYSEALIYFQRSLKKDTSDPKHKISILLNIALSYNRMKENQTALLWIEKALSLDPNHERANVLLKNWSHAGAKADKNVHLTLMK